MPPQGEQQCHDRHAGVMMPVAVMTPVMATMAAATFSAAFLHSVQWEVLAHSDVEFAHVSPCCEAAVSWPQGEYHHQIIKSQSQSSNNHHSI